MLFIVEVIVGVYVLTAEVTKKIFYRSGLGR